MMHFLYRRCTPGLNYRDLVLINQAITSQAGGKKGGIWFVVMTLEKSHARVCKRVRVGKLDHRLQTHARTHAVHFVIRRATTTTTTTRRRGKKRGSGSREREKGAVGKRHWGIF